MRTTHIILSVFLIAGCRSLRPEQDPILDAANTQADIILSEANRNPVYPDAPPFQLANFTYRIDTKVSSPSNEDPSETNVWVFYENRNPTYPGHPNTFTVIVDPITLKTEWMGGE